MTRISSAQIPPASLGRPRAGRSSSWSKPRARAPSRQGPRISRAMAARRRRWSRPSAWSRAHRASSPRRSELQTRMQIQDVALSRASDAVIKLKEDLFQNVGLESGEGVRSQLEEAFAVLKDAMNTNLGGRYLFGGVLNDRPPVTAATLSDLAADPADGLDRAGRRRTDHARRGKPHHPGRPCRRRRDLARHGLDQAAGRSR